MHHRALLQKQCFATGSDRGTGKPHPHGSLEHRTFGLDQGVGHPNCLWAMSEYEPMSHNERHGLSKKAHHSQGRAPCLAASSALLLETRHRTERRAQQGLLLLGPSRPQDNGHERDRLRQRRQDDGGQIQDDGGAGPAQKVFQRC